METVPASVRLRRKAANPMIEVAPGKWVPKDSEKRIQEFVIARVDRAPDGTYKLTPQFDTMVRVDRQLVTLLGLKGNWNVLRRLGRGGWVEMIKISPGCTLINLDTWFNHLRRCAEDDEMWAKGGANYLEYRKMI